MDITGISTLVEAASGIVNRFFPDKSEAQKAELAMQLQDMMNQYNLVSGQIEINKIEAASTNLFVSGWRPFIGWVCGTGLVYQFIFMPISNGLVKAIAAIAGNANFPMLFVSLDTGTLMAALSGILGLGALRTYEKKTGTESNR